MLYLTFKKERAMKKTYENDHFFYGKLNYKDTDGELFCVQHYHNFYELYFLEKDNCNYFIVNAINFKIGIIIGY